MRGRLDIRPFLSFLSLLASPVMADRVVIVWPEIGDYLSILPTSAKSVFSAPFLSRRTISGEKSGNNRRGSSSLGRVIKLMIRGGARAARIREQSTEEEGEQIEQGVDDGNRPCLGVYSVSPSESHVGIYSLATLSLSALRDLAFIRRVVGTHKEMISRD